MSKKVNSREIVSYPLSKFIKDLVNQLIANFLNSGGCSRSDTSQKISMNSTVIAAYNRNRDRNEWTSSQPSLDDITYFLTNDEDVKPAPDEPILLLNGKRDAPVIPPIEKMINYYVFSAGRRYPSDKYIGNLETDSSNGIFHYVLGRDEGIIKNINLEKTTTNGLKEVRFEQEGYNGLEQLREVYNTKIDTFLNVQTFPGTYIYVEPRGFSPSTTDDLTRFGIGGYNMITKTTHTVAPGDASTTINAVWVASKTGEDKNAKNRGKPVNKNEIVNKCAGNVLKEINVKPTKLYED